jgi:ferric-dicitrate binding protein FerR (iron transport regulator)
MHLRAEVDRYLEGRLPAPEHAALREHLGRCEACRGYHDQQVLLLRALAGAPREATRLEVDRSVARVLAATHPAPQRAQARATARVAWWMPLLGAGMATAAVMLGLWYPREDVASTRVVSGPVQVAGLAQDAEIPDDVPVVVGESPAELTLRRGARVYLQPRSVVHLRRGGTRVDLSRGGARFEVDKGKGTFSVATQQATVDVLGTVFSVELLGERTHVTVTEGRVQVKGLGACDSVLGAGEEATCGEPVQAPPAAVEAPVPQDVAPVAEETPAPSNEAAPPVRWSTSRIRSVMAQGNQALLDGHAEEAATRAREVLAQDPRNAEAHRLLGFVYRRQGRTCDARVHLDDFVTLSRNRDAVTAVKSLLAEPEFKDCMPRRNPRGTP